MIDLSGQLLGPYQIGQKVAEGGMAAIYFAQDTRYDRAVAVKVLLSNLQEEEYLERFKREARNAAALQHPHILAVYDSGFLPEVGLPYIVMAWADGGSLAQLLAAVGGPLPVEQTGEILRQTASALDYAHRNGVVHRDIKPSNIMLSQDGQVMLGDFGIAKTAQDTGLTTTGSQLGTPTYMPPEQIKDGQIGPWSDIYALGVVLYQMLSGHPPFEGSVSNVLLQQINDAPPPLKLPKAKLSKTLDRITGKAMAKVPADRYRTAGELAADFQAAIGMGGTTGKVRAPSVDPSRFWPIAAGLALVLLIAAGAFFFFFNQSKPAVSPASAARVSALSETAPPAPTATEAPKDAPLTAGQETLVPPRVEAPVLLEPAEAQSFPAGSYVVLRWSGAFPRLDERFTVAVRDETQDITRSGETTRLEYPLPNIEPGSYTWLVILERQVNGEWVELARSTMQKFTILDADGAAPVPASATPTPAPTNTPPPPPTNTPLPPTAVPRTQPPTATPRPIIPTATPTPQPPTATPRPSLSGKLAFSIRQGTRFKIYVVEMKPSFNGEAYASIGDARNPVLSRDGQWLLADGTGGTFGSITRYASNGEQPSTVTCDGITADSRRPAWSPDGVYLAFDGMGVDASHPQIYIHRIDTQDCNLGSQRFMANGGDTFNHDGLFPLWGPDNRIYFKGCATWNLDAGNCGIWSAQPDGGDTRKVVDGANLFPTDVNRSRLLYMTAESGNWEIYAVNLSGGAPRNLTNHPTSDVWGTLSPEGQTMAFLSNRSGYWAIWLANANGGNPREWMKINPDWGEVDPDQLAQERMSWSR